MAKVHSLLGSSTAVEFGPFSPKIGWLNVWVLVNAENLDVLTCVNVSQWLGRLSVILVLVVGIKVIPASLYHL